MAKANLTLFAEKHEQQKKSAHWKESTITGRSTTHLFFRINPIDTAPVQANYPPLPCRRIAKPTATLRENSLPGASSLHHPKKAIQLNAQKVSGLAVPYWYTSNSTVSAPVELIKRALAVTIWTKETDWWTICQQEKSAG